MYLCCAARLRGHAVRVVSSSGYRHWVGSSFGGGKIVDRRLKTTSGRRALSERNKTYVMLTCYPAPMLHLLFPLHLLLLLFEGLMLSMVKRKAAVLREIYLPTVRTGIKFFFQLLPNRKKMQEARKIGCLSFFSPFRWVPHKLSLLLRHGVPEIR
jgi:hypothetical protein